MQMGVKKTAHQLQFKKPNILRNKIVKKIIVIEKLFI
jgi:hypothetical protein